MTNHKLPQLRVLVTDYCDSNCMYCRPGGEGNQNCNHLSMKYETAVKAAELYKNLGGDAIKITGGDPVFWEYLSEYIKHLKEKLHYSKVELITRSINIWKVINDLKKSGLDVMNFSLDTLDAKRYQSITGKRDFDQYKSIISKCAGMLYCKINYVVLPNTVEDEIWDMITFCRETRIRELKLLDYIDDLHGKRSKGSYDKDIFEKIYKELDEKAEKYEIEFQGGFGHPMRVYTLSDKLKIICKDATQGAWYCRACLKCEHYPCHDAIMALRVTPSDSFQLCLLNPKMHWKFNEMNIEERMHAILKQYQNAFFQGKNI